MSDDGEDEYKVGYGKPPKHTQFKPGESGNSKGRPKKSRWRISTDQVRIDFIDAMHRKVVVRENGRERKKPAILAIYDLLLSKALKDKDFRTAKMLFETYYKFVTKEQDGRIQLAELLYEIEAAEERRFEERRKNGPGQHTR